MPDGPTTAWLPDVDEAIGRRRVAGVPVVVHSQHFARLHHTIVSARAIAGADVLRGAAREAFAPLLSRVSGGFVAMTELFASLGLGRLRAAAPGIVEGDRSHAAHSWVAAFGHAQAPVCTVTEGFLERALACGDAPCRVREVACIACGAPRCRFVVELDGPGIEPFAGDLQEGVTTAFDQHVATLPASFYPLLGRAFLAAMDATGQLAIADDLLAYDSEDAVLRMFAGVLGSRAWAERRLESTGEPRAVLEALLGVSRELGWGPWQLESYEAGARIVLSAPPTPRWLQGPHDPSLALARGAAVGLCELVWCEGALDERYGALQVDAVPRDGSVAVIVAVDHGGLVPGGLAA